MVWCTFMAAWSPPAGGVSCRKRTPSPGDRDVDVGQPAGRLDELRVALVAPVHPLARDVRWLAEVDVALDQPLDPQRLVGGHVPGLVKNGPNLLPGQQVVALGDDERHFRGDRDGAGDRLLDLAAELRGVDRLLGWVAQAAQQRQVA